MRRASGFAAVQDVSPSTPLSLFAYVSHTFRMPLFFLIAGFFARMMIHRKQLGGFWTDRLQRILVPLIIGWLIFLPLVSLAWSWGLTGHARYWPLTSWPPSPESIPLSYLWFLYYLLLIYALITCLRSAALATSRDGWLASAADAFTNRVFSSRWAGPLLLTLPTAAGLFITQPDWSVIAGMPTPNSSLIPHLLPLVAYTVSFALGWMVNRNADLLRLWSTQWRNYLSMALIATGLCLLIIAVVYSGHGANAGALSILERVLFSFGYGLTAACWMLGITGFAMRFLSAPSEIRRYLADASYWVYLVHYPIVLTLQDVLAPVRWHWVIKFPIILAVTLTAALVSYHYLVRFTVIGRVLNGRRVARGEALTPLPPVEQPRPAP